MRLAGVAVLCLFPYLIGCSSSPASSANTGTTAPSTVATPAFSVAAGTYLSSQTVTITDSTSGATIYYTTNGTTPTASSTLYSGPVTVASPETLSAIAAESGYTNSAVESASYIVKTGGIISTVAGNGLPGYSGDGGPATSARVNFPAGVALDSGGNLYFADSQNNRVRKVTLAGTISTVAGNGIAGFSGDGGAATSSELNGPGGVAIDSSGNLYISDSFNQRIRLVTPSGMISTVAGSGPTTIGGGNGSFSGDGGPATSARLNSPDGVALDSSGNLYIADSLNHRIRMVSPIGTISTVAGSGPTGASGGSYGGDGGAATSARLNDPFGVALDASGNLYIADTGNNRVRVVAPLGTSTSGQITTIAGTGTVGFSGDGGMATSAQLSAPTGVAVDGSGNLYIAELNNDRVRGVTPSGVISTLAGNGAYAYNGDGIPATSAAVCDLGSIALDSNGNLYFPDGCNMRVRKVTY